MKALPYFRWFPADAETDAAYSALNWAERGFFHWCLNYSWINNGLPLELDELARAARISRRELNKLWERVGQRFTSESGSWRNPRQEEERTHATAKSERNTAAVRTRYERATNVPTNEPQHARPRADSDSVSVSSYSGFGKSENLLRWKSDAEYVRFVADYLGTGAAMIDADFTEAYEFCWRTLDFEQKLQRAAALNRHAEEYHSNPRFVPKPRKFLETEWERAPRPMAIERSNGRRSTADVIGERIAKGEKPW